MLKLLEISPGAVTSNFVLFWIILYCSYLLIFYEMIWLVSLNNFVLLNIASVNHAEHD